MAKRKGNVMTAADAAAINFEPLSAEMLRKLAPPSNDVWIGHLVAVRVAWALIGKTKAELKEIIREWDAEFDLFEDLERSAKFLKAVADILNTAEMRLLIAGSALESEAAAA
jgi:hypothetical protein